MKKEEKKTRKNIYKLEFTKLSETSSKDKQDFRESLDNINTLAEQYFSSMCVTCGGWFFLKDIYSGCSLDVDKRGIVK